MPVRHWILYLALLAAPAFSAERLGVVSFPNSGSEAAQQSFLRGVLLLHSFEYDDAAAAFREAQSADSSFLLPYWGEAITHYRPVWRRENLDAGRAALEKAPANGKATPRERAYFDAAKIVFSTASRDERWQRYTRAMERLSSEYPDDLEAASLHAVSLFGITGGQRDYRTYMRVAALAERVFRENPGHPGALHYLIHAFDDPIHAPLGLRYARLYSKVASDAPHAQHMPSHIFLALGMWKECVDSNFDSWNSSEARVKRLKLDTDKRGYHALWWMQYAYLQQGRLDKARENLEVIERDAAQGKTRHARDHYAYLRSHFLIDGEQWTADLRPVDDTGLVPRAWGANALAEGIRALKTGNSKQAREWSAKLRSKADADLKDASSLPIAASSLEGLVLLEDGKSDAALDKLREAVDLENATTFGYGPPFPPKPAIEILGETLLKIGKPQEALDAFRAALDRNPRRAISLKGLAKAAKGVGDSETQEWAEAELRDVASNL